MPDFATRQRSALLVLAAISDAQALERSLRDTDVLDALRDTRPFPVAHTPPWTSMSTLALHKAS